MLNDYLSLIFNDLIIFLFKYFDSLLNCINKLLLIEN